MDGPSRPPPGALSPQSANIHSRPPGLMPSTAHTAPNPYAQMGPHHLPDGPPNPIPPHHFDRHADAPTVQHHYPGVLGPPMSAPHTMPDALQPRDVGMVGDSLSPVQPASAGHSHKRAFRQRRKDPSCDACRERKVKCDATDTASCSECSTRNVKCQFTKETNRRMSTTKQVQDLEKQLSQRSKENAQLRAMFAREAGAPGLGTPAADVSVLRVPEPAVEERRSGPPAMDGFDQVRVNILNYCRAVFKPPAPYRQPARQPPRRHQRPQSTSPPREQGLPPRHVADRLLSHYQNSVHVYAPHMHWPTFRQQYEEVYRVGSLDAWSHSSVAVFYGILACGTLMDPQPFDSEQGEGFDFIHICKRSVDFLCDDFDLDTVRVHLLCSIFFIESNMPSLGWKELGDAVRIAQDIGLQSDRVRLPPMEAEMRRRVWWSVYNWDRLVSLEMSRPVLIDDADCDVSEPTPVPDECVQPSGIINAPSPTSVGALIAIIPIVRSMAEIKKTIRSRVITPATLAAYDAHFQMIMNSQPEPFVFLSDAPLDPRMLTAACGLHVVRLILYRHNLSPACRPAERRDALDRCVSVGEDTAHYIQRSMRCNSPPEASGMYSPAHMANWAARVRTMAPTMFAAHLWRCTLVLCLRLHFGAALTIVQASASIGDLRKANVAFMRHLGFFLERLVSCLRAGATRESLETDEEMIAYASGDLQGSADEAWVWSGVADASVHGANGSLANGPASHRSSIDDSLQQLSSMPSESELRERGGWDNIQLTLEQLLQGQHGVVPHPQRPSPPETLNHQTHHQPPQAQAQAQQQPAPPPYHQAALLPLEPHHAPQHQYQPPGQDPPPSQLPSHHLGPQYQSRGGPVANNSGTPTPSTSSRSISIKDII